MTSPAFDGEDIPHGARIGRFVVEGQLGAGGMSVVYAARDRELDRRIALKVLRGAVDEPQRLRLLREGQAMARVTHPNVITVHEVGLEGRLVFLAQELLDGGTLREWLAGRRPRTEILAKFVAAGRGLAAAHAAGLVHRDFKPDNVLLGKDGRVRVADFGLARPVEAPAEPLPPGSRIDVLGETTADLARSPMSPLTRTGAVMGTPLYMAPEQHLGEVADARSDQFSFCVALYEALYGIQPFPGKTSVALADNVIAGRLDKPPANASVPARLRKILLRGLSTRPDDRYPSMDALLAELAHEPARKLRRIAIAAGAAVLIGGAVVGGYVLRSRDDARTAIAVPLPKHEVGTPRDPAAARAFAEGRAALRANDFTTARTKLADVVQREPTFAPGQLELADAHAALFDAPAAEAAAKAALANAAALAREERLWITARAHEHLGDRDRARAAYHELFGTERSLDVGLRLAALQPTDDALATIASLRKQPAPTGTDPRLDVAEGRAWLARDPAKALALAQRAAKVASADSLVRADAHRLEGHAYRARLELDQAAVALDDARKRFGSSGDRVRMLEVNGELAALAIERGDLDEADARYDAIAAILREHAQAPQAGEALAGAAVVLARRGKLAAAEAKLREAGAFPTSKLAAASAALARTELAAARHERDGVTRAQHCTVAAKPFFALASRCLELQGEILAARHDLAPARAAFNTGLAAAKAANDDLRTAAFELAIARLAIDTASEDPSTEDAVFETSATTAARLAEQAGQRGARAVAADAAVLLARAKLRQAASQDALALLDKVTPDELHAFRTRIEHAIAHGLAHHHLGDPDAALQRIDAARAEAEQAGWTALAFAARLARVEVLVGSKAEPAAAEREALIADARARGLVRIEQLATRLAPP